MAPAVRPSAVHPVRPSHGEHRRSPGQMSLSKPFEPTGFRAFFASRWSEFLHENYRNPEEVAVEFGVRFQTALNWWNGANKPGGEFVMMAVMQHGEAFTRHMKDTAA